VINERETLENEADAVSPLLEISELEVHYPSFILGPINLNVESAQIASLLGPNGSGKTTLIRSVLGLQAATRGSARFSGTLLTGRPPQVLAQIGYLTDSADDIIPELTPQEYWEFCAMAYSRFGGSVGEMLDRAKGLAQALGLSAERRGIGSFSLGMRRKTQLVACMLHAPELLVLDEPLIGLDFMSIKALEALLVEERRRGASVWVSSHDLALAHRLADKVFVLHLGSLVLEVKTQEIDSPTALEDMIMVALRLKAGKGRA
jgi:ABC-type multidrug transport system ATPase subunit